MSESATLSNIFGPRETSGAWLIGRIILTWIGLTSFPTWTSGPSRPGLGQSESRTWLGGSLIVLFQFDLDIGKTTVDRTPVGPRAFGKGL